jgi:hypothetical protein
MTKRAKKHPGKRINDSDLRNGNSNLMILRNQTPKKTKKDLSMMDMIQLPQTIVQGPILRREFLPCQIQV